MKTTAERMNITEEELIQRLSEIHRVLYATREKRVRPQTDNKVLVGWNALALRAFAQAARYLERPDYLEAARKNANFILQSMYPEGRLMRAWRKGQARHNAYLEDYAAMILALLDLYESDPDLRWYQAALELADDMQANFRDPRGGFFDTRSDHGELITRPKEMQDNAVPSGNALAAGALLRLAAYDERSDWRAQAEGMLAALQELMITHPTAFGFWLQDLDFAIGPAQQIAVIGRADSPETHEMVNLIWSTYRPRAIIAISYGKGGPESPGLLLDRDMIRDHATAYVCENFTCNLPVNDIQGLKKQIGG